MTETDNNFIPEETSVTDAAEGQAASETAAKRERTRSRKRSSPCG